MRYQRFTTIESAQAYCDAQTALMDLPADSVTKEWATPQALTDGSFVVPAYQDNEAIPWNGSWTLAQAE